jgi:hypothetical protein
LFAVWTSIIPRKRAVKIVVKHTKIIGVPGGYSLGREVGPIDIDGCLTGENGSNETIFFVFCAGGWWAVVRMNRKSTTLRDLRFASNCKHMSSARQPSSTG